MESKSQRKVRSACDVCHGMKMKCSGGDPCTGCARSNQTCRYSRPNRLGRPKGSRNRKAQQQWTRQRDDLIHGVSTKKCKPGGFNEERISRNSTTSQDIPMRFDTTTQSTRDGLGDFFNENSVKNPTDRVNLTSTAMSDKSWQESGDLFDGLDPDMGFQYDGSGASVMPPVSLTI